MFLFLWVRANLHGIFKFLVDFAESQGVLSLLVDKAASVWKMRGAAAWIVQQRERIMPQMFKNERFLVG